HGTVEVRTPDAQADPDRVYAFAEYTAALVEDLAARYEDGEAAGGRRRELLDEHKWRAMRYGHDADLLARSSGETVDLGEVVDREASRLGVSGIRSVYDAESGADRQRRLRAEAGVDALREALLVAPALP
ncbi:carboxylate--amine ligase, partial [Halobacteriales archaeon QH_7_69_31]